MQIKTRTTSRPSAIPLRGLAQRCSMSFWLDQGPSSHFGDAVNTPVLTKIRERHTEHDAENLKADQLWREAYDDAQTRLLSAPADTDDGSVFGSGEEL